MKKRKWHLALLISSIFILSACAAVTEETAAESEAEAAVTATTPADTDPTDTSEAEPAHTPGATEEMQDATQHSEDECQDPFAGQDIRFSPRGWETNFCKHSVPYDEFLSGGPPRDGIPPIDSPSFVDIDAADEWLEDVEPVISLDIEGEARAYPLQILIWHEIVNDTVGDLPLVVTFCPLCNTALVFERPTVDGEVLTFGTSGNLRNSDLVMWDRQTESWWQQFSGEAIVGDLTGTQLEFLSTTIASWANFKAKYPQGQVLSRDTGYTRDYGSNPYIGYDDVNEFPFLFDGDLDDRLSPMARVLGVEWQDAAIAYSYERLYEDVVVNDVLGGDPIVVFWKSGASSAVEAPSVAGGRDVGTTGVFLRTVEGQELAFVANADGTFTDQETGSTWDILGEAIDGPLAGAFLDGIPHHDTFWFAWAAFVPESALNE